MMYLSQLLIDTGENPDRPRPGRLWLNNIYNVHRRLSMAFPMPGFKQADKEFLKPYEPKHFHPRSFIFRIDNNIDGTEQRAVIIVQSTEKPDWDWCFHNAPDFLAAPPESKGYDPQFQAGQELRFRIRVNPSVKSSVHHTTKLDGTTSAQGKRISLTWDKDSTPDKAIADWFTAKAQKLGFTPVRIELIQLGWVYGSKPEPVNKAKKEKENGYWRENEYRPLKYRSALLEGILKVDDPALFKAALEEGIGSAKSFGFGLLSVQIVKYAH